MATYNIGEKPGIGRYCCTSCSWSVLLDDHDDRLPDDALRKVRYRSADDLPDLLSRVRRLADESLKDQVILRSAS
jgi:hypothetical protein